MKVRTIGLYPIVDSTAWLEKLLPLGLTHIQLRIKNKTGQTLENEIIQSIQLAKQYQTILYINDYWELALRHGAEAIHIGQEDLVSADIQAIHNAGMRLGISAYSEAEIHTALQHNPTYVAFGPIFPTTSKDLAVSAQGVKELKRWCEKLSCPVVAIGGINQDNLREILSTGVDGIALISAITQATNPTGATQMLLKIIQEYDLNFIPSPSI